MVNRQAVQCLHQAQHVGCFHSIHDPAVDAMIAYHAQRAVRELNRGLGTSNIRAARAHLKLSLLHRERARSLSEGAALKKPLLFM